MNGYRNAKQIYFMLKTLLLLLVFGLFACGSNLSLQQYADWMQAHHADLTSAEHTGGIIVEATYLPADWLALKEAGAENTAAIAATRQEYAGMEYYRLRIALQSGQGDILQFNAGSTDTYYQRVEYFSFGLQYDLQLLAGQDTLPCRLFHFERNYGAAPYADFMLGFADKSGNKLDRVLLYHDRVFTDSLIRLVIPAEKIDRIPTLKL